MSEAVTHVVELTPVGRGAVAVVLVAGPAATRAVEPCFKAVSGQPLSALPLGQIALGRWRAGEWSAAECEELIVCRRAGDRVEVHCHGGLAAVRAVVDRLAEHGCQQLHWHEWVRISEPDPLPAAARVALAEAPTARTAAILLDQYQGALTAALQSVSDAAAAGRWADAAQTIDELLACRDVGLHLTMPWRVVLAGPPNVGKSSLLNALAGFQRAIVSPLPGTTRDVVTVTTAIDGWPVRLADTAGLREAGDALEAAGIGLAGEAIAAADLVIAVQDSEASAALTPVDAGANRLLRVINKIDLLPNERLAAIRSAFPPGDSTTLLTSAVTGAGIATLITTIGQTLVARPPRAGAAVPFTAAQFAALALARQAVERQDSTAVSGALQALLAR